MKTLSSGPFRSVNWRTKCEDSSGGTSIKCEDSSYWEFEPNAGKGGASNSAFRARSCGHIPSHGDLIKHDDGARVGGCVPREGGRALRAAGRRLQGLRRYLLQERCVLLVCMCCVHALVCFYKSTDEILLLSSRVRSPREEARKVGIARQGAGRCRARAALPRLQVRQQQAQEEVQHHGIVYTHTHIRIQRMALLGRGTLCNQLPTPLLQLPLLRSRLRATRSSTRR